MGTLLLLVLFSPFLMAGALVLLTSPFAWFVFPGGGTRGPHDTLAGRLLGNVLSLLMEWVSGAWVVLSFMFGFLVGSASAPSVLRGRRLVVLLPGYMENALTLRYLHRHLQRRLADPVVALSPVAYWTSLDHLAENYRIRILEWMGHCGATEVVLVGHSMGGLLARMLAEPDALGVKVKVVATLATPHLGSAISWMAPGYNGRQMRRGSAFLEQLNARHQPKGLTCIGICSTHDTYVLPWHCGLSPVGDNFILRYRGHLTLLFSKEVLRIISKTLG